MTDVVELEQRDNPEVDMGVVQAYLYAINVLENRALFTSLFAELESTWLSLYTKEQTCPIVEQTGTFVKRKLVKQYTTALVKTLSGVSGCTFISKLNAKPAEFWTTDEVIKQIADVPTKDHADLFRALLCQVYGVSETVYRVLMDKEVTWLELYRAVVQVYPNINLAVDVDLDEDADATTLTHAVHAYLYGGDDKELPVFV